MNRFDWQVLEALYRVSLERQVRNTDTHIYEEGERVFGKGWGGTVRYSQKFDYEYAPLISLSLGRLEKLGLAEGEKNRVYNFKVWKLSAKGVALAKGMVGHACA